MTAGRGGSLKSDLLEPPFVGRERELRLLKELFHASADERKAHLASIVGIAGIGKSRLAWELQKYFDGVAQGVQWHRGRCLAYGDGVSFWALAEMVRMRAEIAEGEEPESARTKLRSALERYVDDADEREWIEPRLAQLLALEEVGKATHPTCSAAGGSSSNGSPTAIQWSSSSRTCSGPMRPCSSSSSTCSTGRGAAACTCSR